MNRDMEILEISIKTKSSETLVNLAEDLSIDTMNINEAFCEQPAKFAWWATVAAQAKALVERKKSEVERLEDYLKKTLVGELDTDVRMTLEMNGEKVTESKVTNGIYVHPRYKETQERLYALKDELLELQQKFAVLDIAKESMNQRKDMLISLGAQLRLEGGNTELMMKEKANAEVKNNRKKRIGV